jgi:hypothetical protein
MKYVYLSKEYSVDSSASPIEHTVIFYQRLIFLFKYVEVNILLLQFSTNIERVPIPVAVRSKAWVCGRSLTRIVGSNPTGGMDVCLL